MTLPSLFSNAASVPVCVVSIVRSCKRQPAVCLRVFQENVLFVSWASFPSVLEDFSHCETVANVNPELMMRFAIYGWTTWMSAVETAPFNSLITDYLIMCFHRNRYEPWTSYMARCHQYTVCFKHVNTTVLRQVQVKFQQTAQLELGVRETAISVITRQRKGEGRTRNCPPPDFLKQKKLKSEGNVSGTNTTNLN
jgi:hypothetical protein